VICPKRNRSLQGSPPLGRDSPFLLSYRIRRCAYWP